MSQDKHKCSTSLSISAEPPAVMIEVDDAFQSLLKHFGGRQDALNGLKGLALWGHKDGRWFEVNMDKYGLFIDVYQTPDGWHAAMGMGRGIENFDAYRWAYKAEKVEALKQTARPEVRPIEPQAIKPLPPTRPENFRELAWRAVKEVVKLDEERCAGKLDKNGKRVDWLTNKDLRVIVCKRFFPEDDLKSEEAAQNL